MPSRPRPAAARRPSRSARAARSASPRPPPIPNRRSNSSGQAANNPNPWSSRRSSRRARRRGSRPHRHPSRIVKAKPKTRLSQLLASTQVEIDRLTAELDRRTLSASQRDRRKAVNASTQEYQYAAYLESWRRKVEKIGNLNYPDEAKRRKLYGNLLMHVAVRADGSVEKISIRRSSGHKLLDDAAVRIVRMAAPFAPFPPEIRQNVDVLDITRTWQFLDGNTLFSSR